MAGGEFRLSVFGDEIADDLEAQLALLRELEIGYLEVRGVWGKNVLHFTDEEIDTLVAATQRAGIAVSAIGSPVGKSALADPVDVELDHLRRIFRIAQRLETERVRVFSFYPPEAPSGTDAETHLAEAADRLAQMAEMAGEEGLLLLLENEKGIVGDTIVRCHRLLTKVNSPHLRFAWDPANFVQVGETAPVGQGWSQLGPFTEHVHVKDCRQSTGEITAACQGDGEVAALLEKLVDAGFSGFLALEPHLAYAGPRGGFSGVDGMRTAAAALRTCMARVSAHEVKPEWAQGLD